MSHPSRNRSRAAAQVQLAALIAIAIIGIALARVTPAAEPLRLEAQVGVCEQGRAGKGIWWNDAYPTNIDLKSSCWQLGASRIERNYWWGNLGWRAAYVDLGRYHADNQFAMRDDQQFTIFDPGDCQPNMVNCVGRGKIHGRTRGVSLTALSEQRWGQMNFGLEAGALIYYNRFDVTVSPVHPADFQPVSYAWGDWLITPIVGFTANYQYLFATLRTYFDVKAHEMSCKGCSGLTDGPAWQVTLGVQGRFK
jgi:hypothetical protein